MQMMTTPSNPNVRELRSLEIKLHQFSTRSNYAALDALLHSDFLEFGMSGKRYTKAEVLNALPLEQHSDIWSDNYELRVLGPGLALLTYISASLVSDGSYNNYALRTSIWQLNEYGWQMRFHQGTPTLPQSVE